MALTEAYKKQDITWTGHANSSKNVVNYSIREVQVLYLCCNEWDNAISQWNKIMLIF